MSKEGTFEYQRDKYARMLISLIVDHGERFGISNSLISITNCTSLINRWFNEQIEPRWIDIIVDEYPDVFQLKRDSGTTKLAIDVLAAEMLDI